MNEEETSRDSRTFSIEEVGRIIHEASADAGSAAAPKGQVQGGAHERVTWDELREIAADVGVSEDALVRATHTAVPAEAGSSAEQTEAPPSTSTELSKAGRTLTRDVAIAGGTVAVVGGTGAAVGLGTALLWPMLVLAPLALAARSVWLFAPHLGGLGERIDAGKLASSSENRYQVFFGESTVDLTTIDPEGPTEVVDVNVRFGETTVRLDPAIPYRIETSVIFGEVKVPRAPSGHGKDKPRVIVRLNVRFGAAKVVLVREKKRGWLEKLESLLDE